MFKFNKDEAKNNGKQQADKDDEEPEEAGYSSVFTDPDEEYTPDGQEKLEKENIEFSQNCMTRGDAGNGSDFMKGGDGDLLAPFPSDGYYTDGNNSNADGITDHRQEEMMGGNNQEELSDGTIRPGDHVFVLVRRSFGIGTYQKHGIVLSVVQSEDGSGDISDATIASFYHKDSRDREASDARREGESEEWNDDSLLNEGRSSARQSQETTAGVRSESLFAFSINTRGKIQKVKYGQTLARRILSRPGTATSCAPDERGLVLARVKYLLEHPEMLPEFQRMSANDECASVWCRIGRWCTLQGASILHIMIVGHAGGAAVGGLVATNVSFWAPMPGFWGSVGYWWYVPATVAYPILVPILIGFGLVSLLPLEVLRRYRKKWAEISAEMNVDFWANTDEEVREYYYETSACTDDEWMKKFFINDADDQKNQDNDERGKYMPLSGDGGLNAVGDNSDDDLGDDETEAETTKRMSAEYGLSSSTSTSRYTDDASSSQQESKFREQWSGMMDKFKPRNSFQNSKTGTSTQDNVATNNHLSRDLLSAEM